MVLVTDAMAAMGLPSGTHNLGSVKVDVAHRRASVAGTNTLSGRFVIIYTVLHLCFSYLNILWRQKKKKKKKNQYLDHFK